MPIEQNIHVEKREGVIYEPLPEDVYQVELIDITMEEKPKYKNPEEKENVLEFTYGVVEEGELRARRIWRNFVPLYLYVGKNGKNLLYQIIEAHLKRELTPEEEATMETNKLNKLIGTQVRVTVKNKKSGENTYSNIESFLPAKQELTALTPEEKEIKKADEDISNPNSEAWQPTEQDVQIDESKIPF